MRSFDGVRMNAPITAPNGVINAETIFEFRQQGDTISANYSGGKIIHGHLVGVLEGDKFRFRFAQRENSGKLDGGESLCDVEQTSDGRIRLVEHFQWESRDGAGTNVIEELPSN